MMSGTREKGLVLIAGPTASGKSTLALALAEAFEGVIINADSMQVYRELEILTARPDRAALARAPHRLYGVLGAEPPCSAGRWRGLALDEIAAARRAGQTPILVGGSGLYFRALTRGLAPVPDIAHEVRSAATGLYQRLGGERFHALLVERDPAMAARLGPGDRQRLTRAWEVLEATGASLAEWQGAEPQGPGLEGPVATLLLEPPRAALYARCDRRFAAMVAAGAEGGGAARDQAPSRWRGDPGAGQRRRAAGDPALRQAAEHLVPPSDGGGAKVFRARFGKSI
jgi:tRNA dimethylallyltransferase